MDQDLTLPPPRKRTTRRRVHVIDKVTTAVITTGGLAVVVAVLGICVYLGAVVIPLIKRGEVTGEQTAAAPMDAAPLFSLTDEYGTMLAVLGDDGVLRSMELATGSLVARTPVIPEGRRLTAVSRSPRDGWTALGYDDGSVQIGRIHYQTGFLLDEDSVNALTDLPGGGATRVHAGGIVQRTELGQLRQVKPLIELAAPVLVETGEGAVRLVAFHHREDSEFLVVLRDDGSLTYNRVRKTTPLGGGEPRVRLTSTPIPFARPAGTADLPGWLFVTSDGASVIAAWESGVCQRYGTSRPEEAALIETVSLVDPGRRVTACRMLLGTQTMIVGDDAGNVYGYFAARNPATPNADKLSFVRAHELAPQGESIVAIGVSERDRTFITADATGELVVRNMTSHKTAVSASASDIGAVREAVLLPKVDGFLALGDGGRYQAWRMDLPHPEATVESLFAKVWYEGEQAPSHVYQSSSGDDAAEAKYGLTPLIFGTLKATIYTMIIAVPIAILAAIFTSEFLSRRMRAAIKPTIETMASLPSVVLGFIAAIILAPTLVEHLPAVLIAFVVIPLGVLLAAHLWHFVPVRIMAKAPAWARIGLIVSVAAISGFATLRLGPIVERSLFSASGNDLLVMAGGFEPVPAEQRPEWVGERTNLEAPEARMLRREGLYFRDGQVVRPAGELSDPEISSRIERYGLDRPDLRSWLNGVFGGPWPGWFLIAFPAGIILAMIGVARYLDPWVQSREMSAGRAGAALTEMIKFLATVAAGAVGAASLAALLAAAGLDPRDSIFGTFQQRNTLVVALAMSIAVIPIIYTICEDSMASVPDHLRSASLAAGATPWQTAIRVVLPVAMSGVFSATMIGLGRATGETMIVLMATGNTPIMSGSIFDGMRTLSANIAVELPEAPMNSTHYRVLFLCGFVLFVMTFSVNTIAEIIRQRYRKRSMEL